MSTDAKTRGGRRFIEGQAAIPDTGELSGQMVDGDTDIPAIPPSHSLQPIRTQYSIRSGGDSYEMNRWAIYSHRYSTSCYTNRYESTMDSDILMIQIWEERG